MREVFIAYSKNGEGVLGVFKSREAAWKATEGVKGEVTVGCAYFYEDISDYLWFKGLANP